MCLEQNKALAQRLYDDFFNRRHLALVAQIVTADYINHAAPPNTDSGRAGLVEQVTLLCAAFPDNRHVIEDLIAEGDKVVARVTFSGTQTGPFRGVAPTGRRVSQEQIHVLRIAGGKVAEHWAVRDDLGLMEQLRQ